MRTLVSNPAGVISSVTFCLASYAIVASLMRALTNRGPELPETPVSDQGNWWAEYPETWKHPVSDETETTDPTCGNAVTDERKHDARTV